MVHKSCSKKQDYPTSALFAIFKIKGIATVALKLTHGV
jgi:hypothetical protein